jgi:hypothetical protein
MRLSHFRFLLTDWFWGLFVMAVLPSALLTVTQVRSKQLEEERRLEERRVREEKALALRRKQQAVDERREWLLHRELVRFYGWLREENTSKALAAKRAGKTYEGLTDDEHHRAWMEWMDRWLKEHEHDPDLLVEP